MPSSQRLAVWFSAVFTHHGDTEGTEDSVFFAHWGKAWAKGLPLQVVVIVPGHSGEGFRLPLSLGKRENHGSALFVSLRWRRFQLWVLSTRSKLRSAKLGTGQLAQREISRHFLKTLFRNRLYLDPNQMSRNGVLNKLPIEYWPSKSLQQGTTWPSVLMTTLSHGHLHRFSSKCFFRIRPWVSS